MPQLAALRKVLQHGSLRGHHARVREQGGCKVKLFWIAAFAAALCGASDAPAATDGCRAPGLRAMTYNIRLDTEADGENRWAMRRAMLIAQVRLVRPAIAGFQEVLPSQRADLAAGLDGYVLLGGGRDDGRNRGEAAPLLIDKARFRIASHGMFWLSPTPNRPSLGWDAAYPRVATWAHLVARGSGKPVLAVNTHWDHVGMVARRASALQLREWIAAHAQPGEAVLLLGDFNAPLAEGSLQSLLAVPALRDTRAASREAPVGGPATFNGWQIDPGSHPAIDHLIVGPGISVERYHVLAAHFGGRLASDHFPVIADLRLASGSCARRRKR